MWARVSFDLTKLSKLFSNLRLSLHNYSLNLLLKSSKQYPQVLEAIDQRLPFKKALMNAPVHLDGLSTGVEKDRQLVL